MSLESEEKLQEFVRRPGRVCLLIQRDDLTDLKHPLPPMEEVARDADFLEGYLQEFWRRNYAERRENYVERRRN